MHPVKFFTCATAAIIGLIGAPTTTHAAETYHTCTGVIDSLPATISTRGTWCLHRDLTTDTSGIEIRADDVTIDCNNFKIGGLAGRNGSSMPGVIAHYRQNITVRNCNIRGFWDGITLYGGSGHLVEDNRLDNTLFSGITVLGAHGLVRRNRISNTGGDGAATGIYGNADIVDNVVSGMFSSPRGGSLHGISSNGSGNLIHANRVSGLDTSGLDDGVTANADGIFLWGYNQRISDNHVTARSGGSTGISMTLYSYNFCINNTVSGFNEAFVGDCITSSAP